MSPAFSGGLMPASVPLANCEVTEIMEIAPDLQIPEFDLRMVYALPRRSLIRSENPRDAAAGECCTSASDQRPPTFREQAPATADSRPSPVGLALPRLGGLAFVVVIVKPETVVAWHRKMFRLLWRWKIRRGKTGRPAVPHDVRHLIRRMSKQNPGWGAPRIHGELLKLGIEIGETSA